MFENQRYTSKHKSIHRFHGKIFKYKKWFSKRGITPLILKMKYDDVAIQPTYFSMGYPVHRWWDDRRGTKKMIGNFNNNIK